MTKVTAARASDRPASPWTTLYQIAGAAALGSIAVVVIAIAAFVLSPPPATVQDSFAQFQRSPILGLLGLDLLLLVGWLLMVPVYLALYAALHRANESFVALGTILGLLAVAVYISSNPSFAMLSLSNQYWSATTDAQRAASLAAGQAMLAMWTGTAYTVSYVMGAVAGLIIALVMLRSKVFGRRVAWLGIATNVLGIVPPTIGAIGIALSLLSLAPYVIWLVLIAQRLFELGSASTIQEASFTHDNI
jgi:hypothetical protein